MVICEDISSLVLRGGFKAWEEKNKVFFFLLYTSKSCEITRLLKKKKKKSSLLGDW